MDGQPVQTGRIDVHAHLIPGVDDGCPTVEDSLDCCRQLVAAGYTHAFCTPHIWPSLAKNTAEHVREWTSELQDRVTREGIDLKLLPGGEINLELTWPGMPDVPKDQILSYGLRGRHALIDFWANAIPEFLVPAIEYLKSLGLTVILAHPERVKAIQDDADAILRMRDIGVLFQCNTWCLMDRPGLPTRDVAERMLRAGDYFLLGTDCHNAESLPIRLEGVRRAEELVGKDVVDQLTITNPLKLLPNGLSDAA
jgi:protein-tyrosine phosphatase